MLNGNDSKIIQSQLNLSVQQYEESHRRILESMGTGTINAAIAAYKRDRVAELAENIVAHDALTPWALKEGASIESAPSGEVAVASQVALTSPVKSSSSEILVNLASLNPDSVRFLDRFLSQSDPAVEKPTPNFIMEILDAGDSLDLDENGTAEAVADLREAFEGKSLQTILDELNKNASLRARLGEIAGALERGHVSDRSGSKSSPVAAMAWGPSPSDLTPEALHVAKAMALGIVNREEIVETAKHLELTVSKAKRARMLLGERIGDASQIVAWAWSRANTLSELDTSLPPLAYTGRPADAEPLRLSENQFELLEAYVRGASAARLEEIFGARFNVLFMRKNLMKKLGVSSIEDAIRDYHRLGLSRADISDGLTTAQVKVTTLLGERMIMHRKRLETLIGVGYGLSNGEIAGPDGNKRSVTVLLQTILKEMGANTRIHLINILWDMGFPGLPRKQTPVRLTEVGQMPLARIEQAFIEAMLAGEESAAAQARLGLSDSQYRYALRRLARILGARDINGAAAAYKRDRIAEIPENIRSDDPDSDPEDLIQNIQTLPTQPTEARWTAIRLSGSRQALKGIPTIMNRIRNWIIPSISWGRLPWTPPRPSVKEPPSKAMTGFMRRACRTACTPSIQPRSRAASCHCIPIS